MNCPLCIDQTLEPTYRAGIEIDVCPVGKEEQSGEESE